MGSADRSHDSLRPRRRPSFTSSLSLSLREGRCQRAQCHIWSLARGRGGKEGTGCGLRCKVIHDFCQAKLSLFLGLSTSGRNKSESPRNHQTPVHRPLSSRLVSLVRPQGIRKLLQRAPDELRLLPQVGRQESVGVGDGGKRGLQGVLERLGRARRRCVGVLNTSELQETLDSWGGDEGGTAGRRDELEVGGLADARPSGGGC